MMICPHCEIGSYFGMCMCKVVANSPCPFMRRCDIEHRWLPLDSMNGCTRRRKEKEVSALMANEHRVEFESKGKLYVKINEQVKRIKNPFDYTPDKVEIVFVDNQPYIKGFEPKKDVTYDVLKDKPQLEQVELQKDESDINKEKGNIKNNSTTKKKGRRTTKKRSK